VQESEPADLMRFYFAGAFFGTTFPHLLFQSFKELIPQPSKHTNSTARANSPAEGQFTTPLTSASKLYIPRIYGFRVSERARSGPRMQWLRLRPRKEEELDSVDFSGKWKVTETSGDGEGGLEDGDEVADLEEDEVEEEEEEEEQPQRQAQPPPDGTNTRRTSGRLAGMRAAAGGRGQR
jgi:casein kinase II subunit beta